MKTGGRNARWGDANTKFFHDILPTRKHRRSIQRICHLDDLWIEDPAGIEDTAVTFFSKQLAPTINHHVESRLMSHIPRLITDDMNADLILPPDFEEVKRTVFSINSSSAPTIRGVFEIVLGYNWS